MASTKKKRKRDEEKFEEGITKEAEEDMMKVEVEADVLVEEELVLAQEAAHLSQAYHQVFWITAPQSPMTSSIPGAGGHAASSGLCPFLLALPGPGANQGK